MRYDRGEGRGRYAIGSGVPLTGAVWPSCRCSIDTADYDSVERLNVDPDECIDCDAFVETRPVKGDASVC